MIRTRSWAAARASALGTGRGPALALPVLWLLVVGCWQLACPPAADDAVGPRIATGAAFLLAVGCLTYAGRAGAARELRRVQEVADAAQRVLLRPPPPRIDGLTVAAGQLCADGDGGASVGGDLYEVMATQYGVRVVMGDVRGHGLGSLGAVAAVLGSFREAVHDEPGLAGVLRRLERALQRHLRERARAEHPSGCAAEPENPLAEEFVTVLLLEIRPDGQVFALNCGHPWPYRLCGGAEELLPGDPLPPLGSFPLPAELPLHSCTRLLPGEALCLHTDGASDARDRAGRFFRLQEVLARAALDTPLSPAAVIHCVQRELLRHTGGRLADDVALLVLRNDRVCVPAQPGAVGAARARH
ncbi:PP2C family protein-serine/threonine phosphatase [Streptomyces sp. NPDC059070]|uniref:PP2C family protein-serine/threonine phosphatase n=1 Tax=Streptomyces sp. NPDC059070 TaxID=3346713 RepID=UPI003693622B